MKFTLTAARYHPLDGLWVTDQHGTEYPTHTKRPALEAGVVLFCMGDFFGDPPYTVTFKMADDDSPYTMPGTDDPATLALARKIEYEDWPEFSRDWQSIPLD